MPVFFMPNTVFFLIMLRRVAFVAIIITILMKRTQLKPHPTFHSTHSIELCQQFFKSLSITNFFKSITEVFAPAAQFMKFTFQQIAGSTMLVDSSRSPILCDSIVHRGIQRQFKSASERLHSRMSFTILLLNRMKISANCVDSLFEFPGSICPVLPTLLGMFPLCCGTHDFGFCPFLFRQRLQFFNLLLSCHTLMFMPLSYLYNWY